MSRIDTTFQELRKAGRKAFIPFITAGDPDLDATRDIALELARRGADLIEIGFPYSDPIADGPVILSSYTRALAHGIHLRDIFKTVEEIHLGTETPLVGMVSYSLVYRRGPQSFVQQAADAGLSGLIVPDLPVEEAHELRDLASQRDLSLVLLTTPTSPTERVRHIVELCTGFLYCVSVTGITGTRANLPADLKDQLRRLRELTNLPLCAGFGISTVAQVQLLREVVDGIIIGSAIVRLFENSAGGRGAMVKKVGDLSSDLARALNPT